MRFLFIFLLSFLTPQDRKVYVCTGPKAYAWHLDGSCSGLNRCSAAIVKMTQTEAESRKRVPCERCAPGSVTPVRTVSERVSGGQCTAITKKGSRCSRSSRSGGYCWQHGG